MSNLNRCRAREGGQQRVEQPKVLLTRRRELQQHRPEMLRQHRDPLREDPGQADAVEALSRIRQSAVGLHAETKTRRSLRSPVEQSRFRRRAIEAAVQLDSVEALSVIAEHLRAGERGWIELALPWRVAEA